MVALSFDSSECRLYSCIIDLDPSKNLLGIGATFDGTLHQLETQRLIASLSFGATYVPHDVGTRISGICKRPIVTRSGKLALIRREDAFSLAP